MAGASRASVALNTAIAHILENAKPQYLFVRAKFYSPVHPEFQYVPTQIDDLDMVQGFDDYMFNYNEMGFEVPIATYLQMIEYYQDLMCTLQIELKDTLSATKGTLIYSTNLRAIIKDLPDLEKSTTIDNLVEETPAPSETDDTTTLDPTKAYYSRRIVIQLYEPIVFTLRKFRMNAVLRNVTVEDVLHLIYSKIGIAKCSIRTPTNTQRYEQLIIPPLLSLDELSDYLQNSPGLGVYDHGFVLYISGDTMYVYPKYDVKPPTPRITMNFYRTPPNDLLGAATYHSIDTSGNYHVLCNAANLEVTRISPVSLENVGTSLMMLDQQVLETDACTLPTLDINPDLVKFTELNTSVGFVKDTYTAKYLRDQYNPYSRLSELVAAKFTLVTFPWGQAVPFCITPGSLIKYHYLKKNNNNKVVLVFTSALCSRVVYSIRQSPDQTSYNCQATVMLRCFDGDASVK